MPMVEPASFSGERPSPITSDTTTMTITRFAVFRTDWVTALVFFTTIVASSLYEYHHNPERTRLLSTAGVVVASVKNSPSLWPSKRSITGSVKRKEVMVVSANWLPTDPRRSLMPGDCISFLFSFPLKAAKMLAAKAVSRAAQAKLSSPREARATPPMTGIRASHFALLTLDLYTSVPTAAANAGSAAFAICAKDTDPALSAYTVA
mmetsp:Transcript_124505/g.352462  ORF Transcript_124505/g.352462 Transcript_124505/m.352462 type:complete len:206 (-) Transcript_124505:155-772(-)